MIIIANDSGSKHLAQFPSLSHARLGNLSGKEDELSGDIYITGNGPHGPISVSIEVKKIQDLVTSTNNGRLQTQISRMYEHAYRIYVLIVGKVEKNWGGDLMYINSKGRSVPAIFGTNKPVPYEFLESLKLELAECNVTVHHVSTDHDAANWIAHVHKYFQKPWVAHNYMDNVDTSHQDGLIKKLSSSPAEDSRLREFQRVICGLKGIGQGRSRDLVKYFASQHEFFTASVSELMEGGLGTITSKQVWKRIRTKRGGRQ